MNYKALPLFPLNLVFYPGGLLPLKIFEFRYLDMVTSSIKDRTPFAVVAVLEDGYESITENDLPFAPVGTIAEVIEFDVPSAGLMLIKCIGKNRIRIKSARQQSDGLWLGSVEPIPADITMSLPEDLIFTTDTLRQLITSLETQGIPESEIPLLKPYLFDDCSWVSNRWCEFLNLPIKQKQRLLELDSPLVRLELINDMFNVTKPE
jgi:Lon protease-like protein